MTKNRMEAFSDGVLAIIITIMVLEMKVPHGANWADIQPLIPTFLSYLLSFIYLGIYWNNHHHMLHTVHHVSGKILWANLHLLFWLSLIPFTTGWLGENHFAQTPATLYGTNLLICGLAYFFLQTSIIQAHGPDSELKKAIGSDWKGKSSPILYSAGILLGLINQWFGIAIYIAIAAMWFIPDRRIEKSLPHN
ncbi:MAG: TMEM175 family protein [Fimbriimonadaceae bacterium]